jgi:hypothetical protein
VLTVMMLYLVAEGVTQTGGLDLAMNFMLGKASTTFWAQVRTCTCTPGFVIGHVIQALPLCRKLWCICCAVHTPDCVM